MAEIKVCSPARDSKEVEECKELVIDIHTNWWKYCIYRVPKKLRKINEEAYTPKIVSIGPFHHIHPNDDLKDLKEKEKYKLDLKGMEGHKRKYLDDFLKRVRTKNISLEDLRKIVKVNEKEIRDSYSEVCGLESDYFVKMILLDAVFIIELFLKTKKADKNDYILSTPWLRNGILYDLILLENQVPFFILVKLYRFAFNDQYSSSYDHCDQEGKQIEQHEEGPEEEDSPFFKLSCNYFACYYKDRDEEERKYIIPVFEKVQHFTDLLRFLLCPHDMEMFGYSNMGREGRSLGTRFWQFCLPMRECIVLKVEKWNSNKGKVEKWDSNKKQEEESIPNIEQEEEQSWDDIRFCATKLDNAGLKFKGVKGGRCLLDIRPGVLRCIPCFGRPMEVPQLKIKDYTEVILRNLMALEQCRYPYKTYICNYVLLMSSLINTEQDVDLLVEKKVIVNRIGSNDKVATLFSDLCNQIVFSRTFYDAYLTDAINWYGENPWNRIMASIKGTYFRDYGRGIATVGVLLALLGLFIPFLTK